MTRSWSLARCLLCAAAALPACSPSNQQPDGSSDIVASDAVTDSGSSRDVVADRGPLPYDAGPPPSCAITASARHIADRPGGDRVADPAQLVRAGDGYFVAARFVQDGVDGGADGGADGGGTTVAVDRAIVLPLGADGTPAASITLRDGAMERTSMTAPRLHTTSAGTLALFQEVRGNASSPDFLLRLHSAVLSDAGAISNARVARERVALPDSTVMAAGVFATAARVENISDGGVVAASPISMLLDAQGMDARPIDVLLTALWPAELFETRMRTRDDGGAMLVYRRGTNLSFIPFDARGVPEPTGTFDVNGPVIPVLDDAVAVGDAVIAAWSRNVAGTTEVRVVVAGFDHAVRLDQEIERFSGEGPTTVSVVPAYGGAALVWKRGVDANARVRVAVVSPDAIVRVAATDLVPMAPNLEGRLAVVADGRAITFVARDGTRPASWGYTFGRACIPSP